MTQYPGQYDYNNQPEQSDDGRYAYWVEEAKNKLKLPTIFFLCVTIVSALANLGFIVLFLIIFLNPEPFLEGNPNSTVEEMKLGAIIYMVVGLFGLLLNVFQFFGVFAMFSLRNRTMAYIGAIAALIPINCCCILCLPFGIWSLISLSNETVKHGYNANEYL